MVSPYSDCYFCGGQVDQRPIDREIRWRDQLFVIKEAPLGVCRQCGQKVVLPHVAKKIDELLAGGTPPDEMIEVPISNFRKAKLPLDAAIRCSKSVTVCLVSRGPRPYRHP